MLAVPFRRRRQGMLAAMLYANNVGAVDNVSFGVFLQSSLVPWRARGSATPTFTRATTAYVTDFEGLLKPVLSGEARFTGARRIRNWIAHTEDSASWVTANSATITTGQTDPSGGTKAFLLTLPTASNTLASASTVYPDANNPATRTCVCSAWIKAASAGTITLGDAGGGAFSTTVNVTTSYQRFSTAAFVGLGNVLFTIHRKVGDLGAVTIAFPQTEDVTGQSNQNPSEYVSVGVLSAPYHGAGVDGVKYFTTLNGNTVASNVVTEATGAAITPANGGSTLTCDAGGPFGYLAEGARINRCLWSQEFDDVVWVSGGGGIAVDDQSFAAPDGTTTADTLTASGANGTLIQNLGVVASAAKTFSIYLKRKTGTGDVDLTMDGGATWTTVAVTGDWTRFEKTQTLADEDVGIRLVTSGDEVYVWGAQVETASFASSYIPTTTVSVTRNNDILTYSNTGNIDLTVGSCYVETTVLNPAVDAVVIGVVGSGYLCQFNNTTQARIFDSTSAIIYNAGPFVDSTLYKSATKWGGSAMGGTIGGAAVVSGAFDGNLGGTAISPGSNGATAQHVTARNVRIYSKALTDAQLQAMTA